MRVYLRSFPDRMVAHADTKNAFGTLERAVILKKLIESNSAALPYVAALFRS